MSTVYQAEYKRLHTRWTVKEIAKNLTDHFDLLAESNIPNVSAARSLY